MDSRSANCKCFDDYDFKYKYKRKDKCSDNKKGSSSNNKEYQIPIARYSKSNIVSNSLASQTTNRYRKKHFNNDSQVLKTIVKFNEQGLEYSKYRYRKYCFKIRYRMITDQCFHFQTTFWIGMLFNLAPMISVCIVDQKFFNIRHHFKFFHGKLSPIQR